MSGGPSLDGISAGSGAALAMLTHWQGQARSPREAQRREQISGALREALDATSSTEPVVLELPEALGALELPDAGELLRTGLSTPRLRPRLDLGEPIGREALIDSLSALSVESASVSRLYQGRIPREVRLDTVKELDLSSTEGRVDLPAVLASLADWRALHAVQAPCHMSLQQAPHGWRLDERDPSRLLRDRSISTTTAAAWESPRPPARTFRPGGMTLEMAASRPVLDWAAVRDWSTFRVPPLAENLDDLLSDDEDTPTGRTAPADKDMGWFSHELDGLLHAASAMAPGIRRRHQRRLEAVRSALSERPQLETAVRDLLSQQSGNCVDAGLRRLDDLEMLLHCDQLTSTADAGPAALRIALLRRADQTQAIDRRGDSENLERANALRLLIDQRLNGLLDASLPVASAPVYARLAGLRDVDPGAIPGEHQWPQPLRDAADAVFRDEVKDGFPTLRLLLAEEEGAGALIASLLGQDPEFQRLAASLDADFQRDYAAAQDREPDNPMAGLELHAAKEQALTQHRFALLAPWTDRLAAAVRSAST